MGLPHAGSYSFQSEKSVFKKDSGTGLKKIVYALTQSGTDAPVATLLQNDSSLDLSGSVFSRTTEGVYDFQIMTTDSSLFDRLFPSVGGNMNIDSANPCAVKVSKTDLIGKLGRIDLGVLTYEVNTLKDNLLFDTLLTIYINE